MCMRSCTNDQNGRPQQHTQNEFHVFIEKLMELLNSMNISLKFIEIIEYFNDIHCEIIENFNDIHCNFLKKKRNKNSF